LTKMKPVGTAKGHNRRAWERREEFSKESVKTETKLSQGNNQEQTEKLTVVSAVRVDGPWWEVLGLSAGRSEAPVPSKARRPTRIIRETQVGGDVSKSTRFPRKTGPNIDSYERAEALGGGRGTRQTSYCWRGGGVKTASSKGAAQRAVTPKQKGERKRDMDTTGKSTKRKKTKKGGVH